MSRASVDPQARWTSMSFVIDTKTVFRITYLQYSPHIHAAAQSTSAQLPSSLALWRKLSSQSNLTMSWTE